jgi:thioredoxin-related protein
MENKIATKRWFFMKNILMPLLFSLTLFGSQIEWQKDYESALAHAKESNKRLFVFMSAKECKFCKKLEETTVKDPEIVAKINKEYVSLYLDKDTDTYPSHLRTEAVPKLYFLDKEGVIVDDSLGYWDSSDFAFTLDDVQRKFQKRGTK